MRKRIAFLLFLSIAGGLAAQAGPAEVLRPRRLSERVLLLTENSPMENIIAAVATRRGIVVIDSGGSPATALLARAMIEKEFGRGDFRYLINTHPHWDHSWGNQAFPEAAVIGHEGNLGQAARQSLAAEGMLRRARERAAALRRDLQAPAIADGARADLRRALDFQERIAQGLAEGFTPVEPAIAFSDSLVLDLGDVTLRLVYFGRAHSGCDIFIHLPQEKILFTGDVFLDEGWLPLFAGMDGLDVPRWCGVLDRLFADEGGFTTVIPGHRRPWSREKLALWKDYIEDLWAGVQAAKKKKWTLSQAQARLELDPRCLYLRELGHGDQAIRDFHAENVEAFWRQLLLPVVPLIEETARRKGIAAAVGEVRALWRERREEYDFSERALNGLGYRFLGLNDADSAVAVLALVVEMHPASANAHDSLGEAFMAAGDRESAIRHYEKSLQLNPANQNARERLRRLREGE